MWCDVMWCGVKYFRNKVHWVKLGRARPGNVFPLYTDSANRRTPLSTQELTASVLSLTREGYGMWSVRLWMNSSFAILSTDSDFEIFFLSFIFIYQTEDGKKNWFLQNPELKTKHLSLQKPRLLVVVLVRRKVFCFLYMFCMCMCMCVCVCVCEWERERERSGSG